MRILGIDPGSVTTGFGIIDARGPRSVVVHYGAIKAGRGEFPERLRIIFEAISELVAEYQPEQMAIETVFLKANAQSALKLGQARGAAICAAVTRGLPVAEYAPRLVKQAIVGRGGADKLQVQHMVGVLLNLRDKLQEDAADALAIALTHHHHAESQRRMSVASTQQLGRRA